MEADEELRRQPTISQTVDENSSNQGSTYSDSDSDTDTNTNTDTDDVTDTEYLRAANKRISEEQQKLLYSDRNFINEEIHGVICHAQDESPELLQSAQAQLSSELEDLLILDCKNNPIKSSLSAGFLLSQKGDATNTYVNNRDFRLRFLRSENFDAKKAAIRLMKFMNLVLEFFGAFALFRPIKLADFKRSELKVLQTGWLQVLPFRDRSGRKVFTWIGNMGFQYNPVLRMKIIIYMLLAGTRDIESQQKGIVTVVWPSASSPSSACIKNKNKQLLYVSYTNIAMAALPIKICAVHYFILYNYSYRRCLRPSERMLFKIIMGIVSSMLPRIKVNIGGEAELRKKLLGYGIPDNLIPITSSGAAKKIEFKKWLRLQRRIEDLGTAEESSISPPIDCPGSNDVVFRNGSSMLSNPGNVMYRSLIESKIQEVTSKTDIWRTMTTTRKTKVDVATEIIEEISQRRKGRFLEWDNDNSCWIEFQDLSLVKSKIAISYRDLKLKIARSRPTTSVQI